MANLHVIDASATLHAGIKGNFKTNNSCGFLTGGIFNTVRILNRKLVNIKEDVVVFCFDRTTRKETTEYKSGRARWDSNMYVQAKLLEEMLAKMGFNVVWSEDREADECIYAVVNKYKDQFNHVFIYGTDRDLAGLVDTKTSLISTSSHVPDITFDNFSEVVSREEYIPYNAILLYKIFRKDTSDNIEGGVSSEEWSRLIEKLKGACFPISRLNTREAIEFVISRYSCTEEVKTKLWENYDLVMPRDVDVEIDMDRNYNMLAVDLYCSALALSQLAKKLGVKISGEVSSEWYDSMLSFSKGVEENLLQNNPDYKVPEPYYGKQFKVVDKITPYGFFDSYGW